MFGLTTDPARVKELTTTLESKIAAYDVILGKTKYLAGDVSIVCLHVQRGAPCADCFRGS